MEKIYKVEFIKYVDYDRNKVSDNINHTYLRVPSPFLIRESEIEFHKKFGDGIKSLEFVGYINI